MSRRGATLIEIVMAAALLLVVTGVLLQVLTTVMRGARPLDERQDNLQRLIVFREDLTRRLSLGKVRRVTDAAVEMYLPRTVTTNFGGVPRIDASEMVEWDEARVVSVVMEAGGTIVEMGPDGRRVLWPLGAGGFLGFDAAHFPLIAVKVRTQSGTVDGGAWERTFHVMLQQFYAAP